MQEGISNEKMRQKTPTTTSSSRLRQTRTNAMGNVVYITTLCSHGNGREPRSCPRLLPWSSIANLARLTWRCGQSFVGAAVSSLGYTIRTCCFVLGFILGTIRGLAFPVTSWLPVVKLPAFAAVVDSGRPGGIVANAMKKLLQFLPAFPRTSFPGKLFSLSDRNPSEGLLESSSKSRGSQSRVNAYSLSTVVNAMGGLFQPRVRTCLLSVIVTALMLFQVQQQYHQRKLAQNDDRSEFSFSLENSSDQKIEDQV